jgi:hypothetical protein
MPSETRLAVDSETMAEQTGIGELTVCVGAPVSVRSLPATGGLMVVEADQEVAQLLRQDLAQRRDVWVCVDVLTESKDTPVTWFRFNAPRLNGPLTAEAWQTLYPNLRPMGAEARIGRPLDDLLNDWSQHQDVRPSPSLRLLLHQGDPLAVLGGLGDWMAAVQEVELAMPGAREVWASVVDGWLKQRGFREAEGASTRWCRDPVATQQLLLNEQERHIVQLEEQLATQAALLHEAQARNAELNAVCHQLQDSLDGLAAEREALTRQFDQFGNELDKLLFKFEHDSEAVCQNESADASNCAACQSGDLTS